MLNCQTQPLCAVSLPSHYTPVPEFTNCEELARKINKKFNGSLYKLITEPKSFVKSYQERIDKALKSTEPEESTLACCARYNVNEIEKPKMENGNLVFYVYTNTDFPTPRKITCYSTPSGSVSINQECLPYF